AFQKICDYLGIPDRDRFSINLPFFEQIGASALVDRGIEVPTDGLKLGIPVTYVPFRNGIFLSIAGAIGEKVGAEALFIGVVEEDSSGYPDCREEFIASFEKALSFGTKPETKIEIKTPLIHRRKREIVQIALQLGVPLELTWSCYQREKMACGLCDSCRLRLRGFMEAGVPDPLPYRAYPEWYPSHLRK
ncbi:MAG: 7-cyano-7-deazaguanine synthase, partial [Campylobacterales bacterium]